ncbi:MerR family transcriptional regulator [Streptomyces sp. MBT62]|uniref:MerR family transcriptional regulator n=1 Tax=Streptomyces sp. MBT62 TaxID=2800410 RepID=UPI00190B8084|nr:MerR family transcriptional regulator [Streptomyces sp. MBT62]MBK3567494.1 MerR family transcriptional regulator [Streptomyces sp. MBT62]
MRIGELATRVGLSRDALRFYEQVGILTSERRANGYRDYPPEAVPWLEYVRTAQALGFSLAEITEQGEQLTEAPDQAAALSALFADKISLIDARMAELSVLRAELTARVGTDCPLRKQPEPVARAGRRSGFPG